MGQISKDQMGQPRVVTLGNFDGVHLGHCALLESARAVSVTLGLPLMAVTFDPHPLELLRPEVPFLRISSLSEQLERFQLQAVDEVLVQTFSRAFSTQSVADFMDVFLKKHLGARAVVVGYDFRFGLDRKGQREDLERAATMGHFQVSVVPPLCLEGQSRPISSSWIREELRQGRVDLSATLLGRPFRLAGIVEKGAQRGRQLGFPTANVRPGFRSPLMNGVYVGEAKVLGQRFQAVANFGRAPTIRVSDVSPLLEVHLMDYVDATPFYGEHLQFEFLELLRPELKFDSVEQLKLQIQHDVLQAKAFFNRGWYGQ